MQSISLLPGISRSAATIGGALFLGIPRPLAVELSFLLAIPSGLAGVCFQLYKDRDIVLQQQQMLLFFLLFNLLLPLFFMKKIIAFLKKHSLRCFGYYRILLGVGLLLRK
jgi:undecaprenyl-diphosphatase